MQEATNDEVETLAVSNVSVFVAISGADSLDSVKYLLAKLLL